MFFTLSSFAPSPVIYVNLHTFSSSTCIVMVSLSLKHFPSPPPPRLYSIPLPFLLSILTCCDAPLNVWTILTNALGHTSGSAWNAYITIATHNRVNTSLGPLENLRIALNNSILKETCWCAGNSGLREKVLCEHKQQVVKCTSYIVLYYYSIWYIHPRK